MQNNTDALLRILIALTGRAVFAEELVFEIVAGASGMGSGTKQLNAYNLCDGSHTQADVARMAKLDAGNFSRTLNRWIASGIVFRIGDGREATLLHVFPLSEHTLKRTK